jgi:hypothetical protein
MESPALPVTKSYAEKKGPFIGVAVRLVIAAIVVLLALGIFWAAVSTHEPDSASVAGWLMAPVLWLLSSAYRKWKTIPTADKVATELTNPRLASRIALWFLLVTIVGTTLAIAIPLEQRHERSLRIRRLLDEGKALEPASTKNRLDVRSIVGRDVRSFADFRAQTADLRIALDENDVLAIKRNELLNQLTYEFSDYPDALSMLQLFKQITAEDSKASSVFRAEIACSDTLERSDETQQKKFVLLCEAPALRQIELSAPTMDNLLKQAQQRGAKLPPDILAAFR